MCLLHVTSFNEELYKIYGLKEVVSLWMKSFWKLKNQFHQFMFLDFFVTHLYSKEVFDVDLSFIVYIFLHFKSKFYQYRRNNLMIDLNSPKLYQRFLLSKYYEDLMNVSKTISTKGLLLSNVQTKKPLELNST